MSVNLQDYFKLGLDSTNNAGQQPGLINTIRTPADTSSAALNRVTFKVPKIGMLTADSHFNIRFVGDASVPNQNLNLITGALGCVKRMRILMGNKILTDIERPSLHSIPHLYSRNTLTQLSDYHKHFIGCNYKLKTFLSDGTNHLENFNTISAADGGQIEQSQSNITDSLSPTYALPLRMLGADFLNAASMPVFLLQNQEMIIELEFSSDARDYSFIPNGTIAAGQCAVDLPNIELVSTHIQIPDEVEQQQIASLRSKPAQYPLVDTYLVKAVLPVGEDTKTQTQLYRINAQNREIHKMLMVFKPLDGEANAMFANQRSLAPGDENIQMKINGLNFFERPITNSSIIYQVFKDYLDGISMKLPVETTTGTKFVKDDMITSSTFTEPIAQEHFVGFDFKNGNAGIFGAGTIMKSAMEIEYSRTPEDSGITLSGARDLFFYVSVSKMLTIGNNVINVSF